MASQYPYGYPTGYGPQHSNDAPYNSPPMGQMPLAPYGIPPQTRVDASGRPIAQYGASSQSYPATRGQSNQYTGYPSPDSPVYTAQDMRRGYSSHSNSTSGSVPSPQSFTAAPKEKPWICIHPGCLRDDGQLWAFTRKDDFNRHLLKHSPFRPLYDCPVVGCPRVGRNGLPRPDKLTEHIRETHRIRQGYS